MSEPSEAPPAAGTGGDDHANVLIMPPLLYAIALAVGIGLQLLVPVHTGISGALRVVVGVVLFGGGVWLALAFARAFDRIGQDRNPNTPTPTIITDGLYRFSRNPAYVSLSAILLGLGLLLDNVWILLLAIPVVAVMHYGVILREEAYLERTFGDEYRAYKKKVRRWI